MSYQGDVLYIMSKETAMTKCMICVRLKLAYLQKNITYELMTN